MTIDSTFGRVLANVRAIGADCRFAIRLVQSASGLRPQLARARTFRRRTR